MVDEPMSFERFRRSFYYGEHSDMQAKFLAAMTDEQAAGALADVLAGLGEAFDTGNLEPVRNAVYHRPRSLPTSRTTRRECRTPRSRHSRATWRTDGSRWSPPAACSGSATIRWARTGPPSRSPCR